MKITKVILSLVLLSLIVSLGFGQNGNKMIDLLVVKGKFIYDKTHSHDGNIIYLGELNVKNTQDTTVHFWIMDCGWPLSNFRTNKDSVSFRFGGCDNNVPNRIELAPQKSISFNIMLVDRHNFLQSCKTIKVAFIYYPQEKDLQLYHNPNRITPNTNVFWSDDIILEYNLFRYKVEQ